MPTSAPTPGQRFQQLDSLRGLAALTVVLLHLLTVFELGHSWFYTQFNPTPLRVLFAGHEAVIFFFVLSGFVLALPFLRMQQGNYWQYTARRVCRIYLPYVVVITLAAAAWYFIYRNLVFDGAHMPNANLRTLLHHYILTGEFNYNAFNGPVWSLVVEMRVSLLFPVIIFMVKRMKWYGVMLTAICLSIDGLLLHHFLTPGDTLLTNYFDTLHYAAFFMLGALLALHKDVVVARVRKIDAWTGLLFPVMAIYVYINFYPLYNGAWSAFKPGDWGTALGALMLISYSLASPVAARALIVRPIAFLGRISYSLYLTHLVVIFCVAALLGGKIGPWMCVAVSVLLIIPVAYLSWRWLERPSIWLGRLLSRRLGDWPQLNISGEAIVSQKALPIPRSNSTV